MTLQAEYPPDFRDMAADFDPLGHGGAQRVLEAFPDAVQRVSHPVVPAHGRLEHVFERLDFVSHVGATHVLVDPGNHEMMSRILDANPTRFPRIFDEDGWAIYEIAMPPIEHATGPVRPRARRSRAG